MPNTHPGKLIKCSGTEREMSMFVNQIRIRRFRGIKETEEPLELKRFNVLIGRNNSGKTALLEALSLLPHPELEVPWAFVSSRTRLIHEALHGGPLKVLTYKYTGRAEVSYELSTKNGVLRAKVEITPSQASLLMEEAGRYRPMGLEATAKRFRSSGLVGPGASMGELSNLVLFIPSSDAFLRRLVKGIYDNFDLVEDTGAHNRVVREVVNRCVDEEFTEVVPVKEELRLRKEYPNGVSFHVRLEDMGDGLERAISVLLWLEVLRPRLVLWDDFEANMHPSLIGEVLRWLDGHDWQVILATHSLDVLYRLVETWPRDAQVVLLHRTADDVLRASYKGLEELDRALEARQDPRYLQEWLKL